MMLPMKNRITILIAWLFFSSCFLHSAYAFFDKDLHVLTMQNGLVDNTIRCIHKDKDGFMWFGTNDGLSRYDGNAINNYIVNSLSVSYMSISEIKDISHDCLGIISEGVLYVFNRQTESFIPVTEQEKTGQIHSWKILPAGEGRMWSLSSGRLILYSITEQKDKQGLTVGITLKEEKSCDKSSLRKNAYFETYAYAADQERIWVMSSVGDLYLFDPSTAKMEFTVHLFENHEGGQINTIIEVDDMVWVGTIAQGIVRYDLQTKVVDQITYGQGEGKGNMLSHTDVFKIIPVDNGRFLVTTWSGCTLLTLDKRQRGELKAEIYSSTISPMHRNLETRMISAYYDPNGIIWIGTNGGGVLYSDLRSQYYNQYHQVRHNEICGITVGNDHHVWLATYHKGIMRSTLPFNIATKLDFECVGTPEVREKQTVLCTLKDEAGTIWFGNKDGTITAYHEDSRHFTIFHLSFSDGTSNTTPVWALCIDSKQNFWVGTEAGLIRFEPERNVCRRVEVKTKDGKASTTYIRTIAETKDGALWLGSGYEGLWKMVWSPNGNVDVMTGFESEHNRNLNSVRSLCAASDGNLYIGYTNGFAVLSPVSNKITEVYTTRQGLCSNFIGSIVEDRRGHIWLGSNSGMSRYSRHQHIFYNYYIAGSNRSSYFYDKFLFWGNNKSLTYYNPDNVDAFDIDDKVLLTGLEIKNRPVGIGEKIDGQTILCQGVSFCTSIVLENQNRDFSLSFNNLSYSEMQKYNYRLLPYQKEWLISNEGRKVSYTNLPEGDYTFEVRNIFPDGHEGAVSQLEITILPHWSHSLLFRLLVILLILAIIYYWIRLVKRRHKRVQHSLQMKHELMMLNLERNKDKQIRIERENFFTSAAHELRTPLTLILAPLQELMKETKTTESIYSKLHTMYKNGVALHTLVDHLLYVQKIEAGMVHLRLSEVDVVGLVRNVTDSFRQIAESREVCFNVDWSEEPVILWVDVEKISSAVKNLLSNAFKYTSSGGTITVSITRTMKDEKGFCLLSVSDTGAGIKKELQERIFDSFVTGTDKPAFSTQVGVGLRIVKNTMDLHHGQVLLDSEVGKGSRFTLYIPEGKSHFADDQFEVVCDNLQTESITSVELLQEQSVASEVEGVVKSKYKLLIVEDNESVRSYVHSLFASTYQILEAENGEIGLQMAMEEVPDLIILDVMMPVKDGFTCCREIRNQPKTAHIPVLMLTAKAEDNDILLGSRCGADDYMMKPFNPEILKVKVGSLISQRERLKRIYTKALMLKQDVEVGEKEDEFMNQIISIIEQNISDENFSVKLLAEQLNMSQPTLYRKLKQHTNLNVIDIIRRIRISKAASLIMENRYSIQEVSERVGFSDTRTLRKHFVEQFGVSPSKYASGQIDNEIEDE